MNYINKSLVALLATSIFSVSAFTASAQAAVMDSVYERQAYVGIKAGQFSLDDTMLDDPTAYGVYAGYNLDPNFAIEIEYVGSDEADINIRNGSGKVDMNTYGAYAAYRYYFPSTGLYTKGRLGFATTETDIVLTGMVSGINPDRLTEIYGTGRDTNVSGGVGIGYAINEYVKIEGEYDFLDSDVDLMTIGASVQY